jgi:Na+/H+-translocating membrane pyrophosphatase
MIIGYITEYFTSHSYTPVRELANACKTGAATNIIYGLALGYKSVIIPIFAIPVSIFVSFSLAAMYGVAVAALGMLSTIATGLAIDAYGPISDNAGGIAEMAGMSHRIRERTDALDAAGNTTAAIGKGFCDRFCCSSVVGSVRCVCEPSRDTNSGCVDTKGCDRFACWSDASLLVLCDDDEERWKCSS